MKTTAQPYTQQPTAWLALNAELPFGGDSPPAEMMLIPPGPIATGRDGRAWNNSNPQRIVEFFKIRGLEIPIDLEHSTEIKGPKGEPAPAIAWVKALEARPDGSVWGTVEWTPAGTEIVMNRQYRYYSPAIVYNRASMDIAGISSVGLTNKPNFSIPALNHEGKTSGGPSMEYEQLLAALGLPAATTLAAALNHISQMQTNLATALNHAENPPLDKFVPRADYDTALNRASNAETKLADQAKEQLETSINSEIAAALKAGKITPATKEYHVAQCRQEGGLDRFKTFVAAAPVVAGDSGLNNRQLDDQGTALNAEERKICDMMGISVEEYKKANNLK